MTEILAARKSEPKRMVKPDIEIRYFPHESGGVQKHSIFTAPIVVVPCTAVHHL